jgi:pimeloyl-ACP methyl ester carboxylesterase
MNNPNGQAHYMPRDLGWGRNSRVHWSIAPRGRAIVFVHGFGGAATSTWNQFAALLTGRSECAGDDLIFYGYDGLRSRARVSAIGLRDFLEVLFDRPAERLINPTLLPPECGGRPRGALFAYEKVVLVAHSLGAVVCRQALLEAHYDRADWTEKVRLVLFAPAHMGANIVPLVSQALTTIPYLGGLAAPFLKFRYQVLQDLEPGSTTLKMLLKETMKELERKKVRRAIARGEGHSLVASLVVLANPDPVVDPNHFGLDPGAKEFPGKGHKEVCKPSSEFLHPVERLLEVL